MERGTELAEIEGLLARHRAGGGGGLWFEGPPGIGKSALLSTALDRVGHDVRVARAAGHELEQGFPFGVVLQLLEPHVRAADDARRARLFAGAAGMARPLLLPEGGLPAADVVDAVVHGLLWFVANLADDAPLLLAVDDLQWADQPSLRFLHYLAGRLDDVPVALVGASRPPGDRADALDHLLRHRSAVRLRLQPLSEAAVSELAGAAGDAQLTTTLHRLTGGNPLLVRELLENLGVLRSAGDLDSADATGLPTMVRRIRRLPERARRFAGACAVVDDGGSLALAAELAGLSNEDAAAARAALVDAAVLADDRVVRFVHPLVRSSAAATVDPLTRSSWHQRAAALLDRRDAPVELVAAHLEHADPGGDVRAVEVLHEAARRAVRAGSPERAARWLRRALAEGAGDDARARLLFELAVAEAHAREDTWRQHLDSALLVQTDPVAAGAALLRLSGRLHTVGALADAEEVAWRGVQLVGERDPQLRLRLLAAYAAAALIDLPARRLALRRIEAAIDWRALGADAASRTLLTQLAYDSAIRGGTVGQPDAAEVVATARRALDGDEGDELTSTPLPAINALVWSDELDLAEAMIDREVARATRAGDLVARAMAANFRAPIHLLRARPGEAAADAEVAVQGFELGWRVSTPGAAGNLALARLELGDVEGAAGALLLPDPDRPWAQTAPYTFWLYASGLVAAAQGRLDDALDALLACGQRQDLMGATNPLVMPWRSAAALVLSRTGDEREAMAMADEELALAERFGAARGIAVARRTAALVGPSGGRVDGLRAALALLDESSATVEHLRTQIELGAALRLHGEKSAAREPLRAALEVAERNGAVALAERARTELAATGARPRRAALRGPDALTPSERRVAMLAAGGRRNRDIAEELFVSVKAVEFHLGNAFRKLGISSREQLGGVLADAS